LHPYVVEPPAPLQLTVRPVVGAVELGQALHRAVVVWSFRQFWRLRLAQRRIGRSALWWRTP
jgi:hypothetical protein